MSENQLKEALLKEKISNSSRKFFEEKTQQIPFLHETSILNHKCEQIHSNELENVNLVLSFFLYFLKKYEFII